MEQFISVKLKICRRAGFTMARFFIDPKCARIVGMTVAEVRKKYLEFFEKREHVIVPSASLVPENDPTTLFTGSGMQPLIPYLLGEPHPEGKRLVNSQKCFRSEDIEEVGDNRHTTFFEMLGNWSLGSYWKDEQLPWLFEFLTKELGIPKEKLSVTYFEGEPKLELPKDTESAKIWENLGIPRERIHFYGAKKNWWSRAGVPENMPAGEPGGPDSEIFYEFTQIEHDPKFGDKCHPNCDCGRFMEIGNSVFMEYRKTERGFEKLPQKNVDFGGGLERITAAANDEPDIFKLDVFAEELERLEGESRRLYTDNPKAFRIILDHTRAARELMRAGVMSSNLGQGYVVRRLVRRAMLFADRIGASVGKEFAEEEEKFRKTLKAGMEEFERVTQSAPTTPSAAADTPHRTGGEEKKSWAMSGITAFSLFSTFGIPIDVMVDLATERGLTVDAEGFRREFEKHREISRAGAEKKFKGGLADTSEMSVKYHTATHLLHQALRDVLGPEVRQKGSNITPERLRFDFTFPRKMTEGEKQKVENAVNDVITKNLSVHKVPLSLAEAKQSGALHFFDEKYPDKVLVHYIGDSLETAYSKEFCGGPHVQNTGVLGVFKIVKEEAVSAGVRRIKAVLNHT
jgi:alanyl-tRNA synthetase